MGKEIMRYWSEQDLEMVKERINRGRNKNRPAVSADNMESTPGNESVGAKKIQRLDSPCSIHIHSRRHRLADSDGISGKALIDGLVHAGVIQDDSPEYVTQVTYSQEKVKKACQEETEIIIRW